MMRTRVGCSLITAFLSSLPAARADVVPLESLRVCAKIADSTQRLACYDHEVAQIKGAAPAKAVTLPPAAAAPAAAPLTPEQKLGLSNARVQQLESSTPPVPHELRAHIGGVSLATSGRWVFTLDNGQVWQQSEAKPEFTVNPGDAIEITSGALGSFWLSTDNHHSTRVKRAR